MPKTYIETLINEEGGTVNIKHETPHIIPKILTKQIGLANDIDFVGRKDELKKVDELLNQNSMLLLLNGIGGIGKSALAFYYLNQHKENFDYYGFVQVNEDIKLSLASALSTSLDLKSEKIDDLFAEIMKKLQNLEGKKLLIIDDVKEMDNQLDEMNTLMTLKNSGFQILFTSREDRDIISNKYPLGTMCVEDTRELFLKYHATDEMDKVDKILEYLDYHTLFIEVTAKTLTKRKRTLSLDQMIEKFANGEFASIKKNRNESFNQFLNDLFANDKILQDGEILLFLKRLSVLPSIEISFEDLYKFLACEDEERLEGFLIELVENGWLIESDGGYKFHQILKEFVFDSYLASFEEIEVQVDFYSKLIRDSATISVALTNKANLVYFESLNKILEKINTANEKIGNFYLASGNIFSLLGIYHKSKYFYNKTLQISERIFGKEHLFTATSYNNLANIYERLGDIDKAEPLYIKALKIRENILGENHPHTAQSYNNLATLYLSIKTYNKKIEQLLLKALAINEKILGESHPMTSTFYNNLAGFYYSIERYKEAEYFYLKDLKICEKIHGLKHPDTAFSYSNLAVLYKELENYKKAETFYYKALEIRKSILGEEHDDTASSYNNLAIFYFVQEKYEKAQLYMNKAVSILSNIFPIEHPKLIKAKKGLSLIEKKLKGF